MRKMEKQLIEKFITKGINPTNGIDVGCGPKIKSVENCDGQEFQGVLLGIDRTKHFNPDLCCDISEINKYIKDKSIKLAILVHTLEDIENPYECLRNIIKALTKNGILIIICPYRDRYPRIGTEKANGAHKFDYEPYDVKYMVWRAFAKNKSNYEILSYNTLGDDSFEIVVKNKSGKLDYVHLPETKFCEDVS